MIAIWIFLTILAVLLVADAVLRSYAKARIADMFENVPPFNVAAPCGHPLATPVVIHSASGIQLSGSLLWPSIARPHGLVIFFPELNGNHWMATRYCEGLLHSGFAILGFDFRNQGDSETVPTYAPIHWLTEFEMQDVAAVLEFIESDPELSTMSLVAFGVSRGGVAALFAGSRYPRIRAVIADSAFSTMSMMRHYAGRFVRFVIPTWLYTILPSWHIGIALKQGLVASQKRRKCQYLHLEDEVAGLAQTPVLLISGKRDSYVTPAVASELQTLIGGSCELWMVDQAKHNMARTVMQTQYDQKVVAHLYSALGIEQSVPQTITAAPEL